MGGKCQQVLEGEAPALHSGERRGPRWKRTKSPKSLMKLHLDKAASMLLLHVILSIMSASHSYLSEVYFSLWHKSLLLLYSVGTAIRDLFSCELGFLKGRRSINDEYSWLDLAYLFIFSGFLILGYLAMRCPSSALLL